MTTRLNELRSAQLSSAGRVKLIGVLLSSVVTPQLAGWLQLLQIAQHSRPAALLGAVRASAGRAGRGGARVGARAAGTSAQLSATASPTGAATCTCSSKPSRAASTFAARPVPSRATGARREEEEEEEVGNPGAQVAGAVAYPALCRRSGSGVSGVSSGRSSSSSHPSIEQSHCCAHWLCPICFSCA